MQVTERARPRGAVRRALETRVSAHLREIVTVAPVNLLLRSLGAVVGFGGSVAAARILGADGAGIYYLSFTIVTIAAVVSRLGLDMAAMRSVAGPATEGDWRTVARDHATGRFLVVLGGIATTIAVVVLAPMLAVSVFGQPQLTTTLRIMAIGVGPLGAAFYHAGSLKGAMRPRQATYLESVGVPLLTLAFLPALAIPYGLLGAASAFATAATLTAVTASLMWRRTPARAAAAGRGDTRALLKDAWPFFWIAVMNLVMQMADLVLLGIFRPEREVGIYGAAMRAGGLLTFILIAVNSIAAPRFAAMWKAGDRDGLRALAQGSARLMTAAALPPALVLILWPEVVLAAFGPEFRAGATALAVVTVGQLCNVAAGSVGYLLAMTGHQAAMRNRMMASAVLFIGLNLILIPPHGALGAGVAFGVSLAAMNGLMAIEVRRRLGFWTVPFVRKQRGEPEGAGEPSHI